MPYILRPYGPSDFIAVRDLLVETHAAWGEPVNWRIERWNWCRFGNLAYLVNYPRNLHPTWAESLEGIRWWEAHVGLWEAEGQVVAVINTEHTAPGECWVQRRPGHEALLPEALAWAEAHLADAEGQLGVWAYDHDAALQEALVARGYVLQPEQADHNARYDIGELPRVTLPDGFSVASMAEGGDPLQRAEGLGRGFGHADPGEWGTVRQYEELLSAPDYDPTLDLHVIAPNGKYVSQCLLWHDTRNRIGILEPVATHPDYRRMGLGRAVIHEGIRRVAARGATAVWVGSKQPFYLALGFEVRAVSRRWERRGR